ncbi:MAG: hypothetical protein K2I84_04455, partial [Bacteroidales bacterium]|nr:hypothetical protein [Bacteroidales bacterium]
MAILPLFDNRTAQREKDSRCHASDGKRTFFGVEIIGKRTFFEVEIIGKRTFFEKKYYFCTDKQ